MESPNINSNQRLELAAFWQQLCLVNSAIQDLEKQSFVLWRREWQARATNTQDVDDLDGVATSMESTREFLQKQRDIVRKLEDVRDSIRATINERVRPTLRSLNILDLPDEILVRIFEYTDERHDGGELYFFTLSLGGIQQVKNLRLTCRRFRNTSSHLLLHHITVDLTQSSIAHLEEVSHNIIGKGIRGVQVILGFYDSVLAESLYAFAAYQASKLRSSIEEWEFQIRGNFEWDKTPKSNYENAIARAALIAESWEEVAVNGICEDLADYGLLQRAQAQYKQCYEGQKILRQGLFIQSIASAMARMPRATWLELSDHHHAEPISELRKVVIWPQDMHDHDLLLEKLTTPIKYWEDAREFGLGQPPAEIIPKLLVAIYEKEVRLTGLNIYTPPPEDLSLLLPDKEESTKFTAATMHLKALVFAPRHIKTEDDFWALKESNEWKPFSTFLSSLLSSTAIQRIDLNLHFTYKDALPPLLSMGPIVLSHPWPKLKILGFSGPFHFEELQNVVRYSGRKLGLQWSGYLMTGCWAEVLDFLKESISKGSVRISSEIGSASGAECEGMTGKEREFIFSAQYTPYYRESRAIGYLQGWPKTNPVRTLLSGEIV